MRELTSVMSFGVLAYFAGLALVYGVLTVAAAFALRRYARSSRAFDVSSIVRSTKLPRVTLIVPAYNEEATCVEATRALLSLTYTDFEVILVNDGSADGTLDRLGDSFGLVPSIRVPLADLATATVNAIYHSPAAGNLWVVDKANGGKADALNAGLNFCHTPLFCALDADTLLEPDALARVVRPFLEDSSTVAAGGVIRVVNDCRVEHGAVREIRLPRSLIAKFQVLEYLRAFLIARVGWAYFGMNLIISGAFGLFRRTTVIEAGGYATDTVGEDMELVVRLHRFCREQGIEYRIAFVPDPVAWTEAPESLRVLGRQRDRWQRGLVQVMMRHRTMLFGRRYGRIGGFAYPFYFVFEALGPLVELAGYVVVPIAFALGLLSPAHALTFLMVAIAFGVALSVAAVALEEATFRRYTRLPDLLRMFWLAIIENFGYRQLVARPRAPVIRTRLSGMGAHDPARIRRRQARMTVAGSRSFAPRKAS